MKLTVPLDRAAIAARIPHAGGMCLLDRVTEWDATLLVATTQQHRSDINPLRHANRLGVACGIEIAAQAMALHGGLLGVQNGEPPPRAGFLASVRDVSLHTANLDSLSSPLEIRVLRVSGDSNMVMYQFRVLAGARIALEGRAAVILDADKGATST